MKNVKTKAEKARDSVSLQQFSKSLQQCLGGKAKHQTTALAWFALVCHATESLQRDTPEETLVAVGERNVWIRLQDMLNVSEQDIRDALEDASAYGE